MADISSIGKSGLFAAKQNLETTSHNLSNVNTDGYSRQRVNLVNNPPVHNGSLTQGTGVKIRDITRSHDPFVERRLLTQTSTKTFLEEKMNRLEQVENLFNEIDNDGLMTTMNRFYNAFKDLAAQPENQSLRSIVRDAGSDIVRDFHRLHSDLEEINNGITHRIKATTNDINSLTAHIAKTNLEIQKTEINGQKANDLRDQRDLAVQNLSKILDIQTFSDDQGHLHIMAKGVGTLVTGGENLELVTSTISGADGQMEELYYKDRQNFPLSSKIKEGSLGAMITMQRKHIGQIAHTLNKLAFNFANAVNEIHTRGYVARDIGVDSQGRPAFFDHKGPVSGIEFFSIPNTPENAAQKIDLSRFIKDDITNIVSAYSVNAPGDNRIALAISKIQAEKILDGGTKTLEEEYLQIISSVGNEAGRTKLELEQSNGILTQLQTIKDRISGVSLDEEAANLVRFQQAYDASAKMLKTADEMFKTVLTIVN